MRFFYATVFVWLLPPATYVTRATEHAQEETLTQQCLHAINTLCSTPSNVDLEAIAKQINTIMSPTIDQTNVPESRQLQPPAKNDDADDDDFLVYQFNQNRQYKADGIFDILIQTARLSLLENNIHASSVLDQIASKANKTPTIIKQVCLELLLLCLDLDKNERKEEQKGNSTSIFTESWARLEKFISNNTQNNNNFSRELQKVITDIKNEIDTEYTKIQTNSQGLCNPDLEKDWWTDGIVQGLHWARYSFMHTMVKASNNDWSVPNFWKITPNNELSTTTQKISSHNIYHVWEDERNKGLIYIQKEQTNNKKMSKVLDILQKLMPNSANFVQRVQTLWTKTVDRHCARKKKTMAALSKPLVQPQDTTLSYDPHSPHCKQDFMRFMFKIITEMTTETKPSSVTTPKESNSSSFTTTKKGGKKKRKSKQKRIKVRKKSHSIKKRKKTTKKTKKRRKRFLVEQKKRTI